MRKALAYTIIAVVVIGALFVVFSAIAYGDMGKALLISLIVGAAISALGWSLNEINKR